MHKLRTFLSFFHSCASSIFSCRTSLNAISISSDIPESWQVKTLLGRLSRLITTVLLLFSASLLISGHAFAARTINSVTVDGSSSVSVSAGATISALVTVTTTGSGSSNDWESTGWRIAGSSGSLTCNDHADFTVAGTASRSFNITAPATNGIYNLYLVAYQDDNCTNTPSSELILSNAVFVGTTAVSCVTFRDEFSTESYSRQDGSANWSTNWNEVGDNGAVSNGDIEISAGKLQLEGDGSGATALGEPYIEREADLFSYATATLNFNYYETGTWESDDDIEIYVSSNGGSSWNLIHTFNNDQGSTSQLFSQDISAYIASNTRIAFVEKANSSSELFFFDNVQIEACSAITANPTVNNLSTIDTTPVLTGTFDSSISAGGFSVEINSVIYTLGSSAELTSSGSNWTLDLSSASPLSVGVYNVIATSDDGAGTILTDTTVDELNIIAPVICNTTFRDNFSNTSFGNNDGTANFTGNWDEYEGTSPTIPEASPNPASGHVRIIGGQLVLNNYSPETQNFPGVERELDLSPFSSATFSFDFVTSGIVDTTDSIVIMASANGGTTWAVLEDIRGINDTSGSKTYDLTPYISNNTKIRMRFNNETVSGLGAGCCYGAAVETFAIDNVQIEACSSGGGGDTPATAFNCVENAADGISGKLYTKTTAQSFSFDVVALQDASTIETNFASGVDHTVSVELVDASSGSCSTYSALSPAVSQNLLFTTADAGIKASVTMTSGTAYSNVKCRITDATDSPSIVGCSTDSFAIRPTTLSISSNLTNSGSTGAPIAKAGENFSLIATATTGYNGTLVIDNANIQAHAGAIQTGNISGSFGAANVATGIATGSAFQYSEVGSLRFNAQGVYDDSFTAVDQASDCTDDFSNTVVLGKVGCKFGNTSNSAYFGRFTPDHFDVSLNTPAFAPSCGTFSYLGQALKYASNPVATISAKNASGSITQNYTGSFWKINSASLTPSYTEATVALNVLDSSAPIDTDNGNGTGLLTYADTSSNILALTKGALSAPFDAEIALSFTLSDTDAIVVANVDGIAQLNPVSFGAASAGNGISFANKSHRWGRVVLENVHGSELTPLAIPLSTEYYNGINFIKNSADNCTGFTLANDFSISDAVDFNCSFATQITPVTIASGSVRASMSNPTVSSGATELTISDNIDTAKGPGAGNTGYVDITTRLTNLSWLLYDWDADGTHDNCPSARATFGIYKGNDHQIYFREVY